LWRRARRAAGELPCQQWSDVFREGGPGELGAGFGSGAGQDGADAAPDVMLFGRAADGGGGGSSSGAGIAGIAGSEAGPQQAAAAAAAAAAPRFELRGSVSCSPHALLAAQSLPPVLGGGSSSSSSSDGSNGSSDSGGVWQQPGLLLGLTDDVDCAVVRAVLPAAPAQQQPRQQHAAGTQASMAAAAAGSSGAACAPAALCHLSFLPALAYVAAGKTQRRHLLLGEGVQRGGGGGRWAAGGVC
jgi:hypothetical protein